MNRICCTCVGSIFTLPETFLQLQPELDVLSNQPGEQVPRARDGLIETKNPRFDHLLSRDRQQLLDQGGPLLAR